MLLDRKGDILIAEPFMDDPNFKEAVVLICDDEEDQGTVGFILNKPIDMKVEQLVLDFPEFDAPVYFGGPVGHDSIHYVHTAGEILDGSTPVYNGIYWGGDFEKLKFLIRQKLISPSQIKFFVGYTGWSPGQLKEELKLGSWVVDEMDNNYLFKVPSSKLWKSTMRNKGDSFGIIAEMPKSISWN